MGCGTVARESSAHPSDRAFTLVCLPPVFGTPRSHLHDGVDMAGSEGAYEEGHPAPRRNECSDART